MYHHVEITKGNGEVIFRIFAPRAIAMKALAEFLTTTEKPVNENEMRIRFL